MDKHLVTEKHLHAANVPVCIGDIATGGTFSATALIGAALSGKELATHIKPLAQDTATQIAIAKTRSDLAAIAATLDMHKMMASQGPNPSVDPNAIPLDHLKILAAKFGEHDIASRDALTAFLTLKAQEYRTYRAQIDRLDNRIPAIDNLKGAAQDAADNLDFDQVESLLARVDEVETEIMAETRITRARNALMRGHVDQAYTLLTAAADSFASTTRTAAASKRVDYADILYQHGLHFGGPGLALSAQMLRAALALIDANTPLWAKAQNSLAGCELARADHSATADPHPHLRTALEHVENALTVYDPTHMPYDHDTATKLRDTLLARLA